MSNEKQRLSSENLYTIAKEIGKTGQQILQKLASVSCRVLDCFAGQGIYLPSHFFEITGVVHVTGSLVGSYFLRIQRATAQRFTQKILKQKSPVDAEHLWDWVGETANLLCGNSKHIFTQQGWHLHLSVPHVVTGRDYLLRFFGPHQYAIALLESEWGLLQLEMHFQRVESRFVFQNTGFYTDFS